MATEYSWVNDPGNFKDILGELPSECRVVAKGDAEINVGVLFSMLAGDLKKRFGASAKRLAQNGMLWIAWPKKASGVATT